MKPKNNNVMDMWLTEVKPLVEQLELRENRRNHIDEASSINEIMERFEKVIKQADSNAFERSINEALNSGDGTYRP